jgi:hypothetical protein
MINEATPLLQKQEGVWMKDLLEKPPPPWLFNGFLRDKSITMVNAAPYSGKTMLLLAMELCQDFNKPLFNTFYPTYSRSGLFIGGGDAPDWDYGGQAKKLLLGMGVTKEEAQLCEVAAIPQEGPRITDQSFVDWVCDWWKETGFGILAIDTLLSVHRADENNAREMGGVMATLKHLRDILGIAIIFGHHDTKNTTDVSAVYRGRGSGVIGGSVDFMLSLSSRKNRIKLTAPKHRGGLLMENPVVYFDIMEEMVNNEIALKLVPPANTREEFIYSLIAKEPTHRKTLVGRLVDKEKLAETTAYHAVDTILRNLSASGRVKPVSRGVWGIK